MLTTKDYINSGLRYIAQSFRAALSGCWQLYLNRYSRCSVRTEVRTRGVILIHQQRLSSINHSLDKTIKWYMRSAASFFNSSRSLTVAASAVSTPSSPTFCAIRCARCIEFCSVTTVRISPFALCNQSFKLC